MNKRLIALAIAGMVSVPALADTSNVQLYGMLDAGVDSATNVYADAYGNAQTNRVGRVSDYGSFLGLKGSENLSNGLSGVWQIEQGVAINGGNAGQPGSSSAPVVGSTNAFGANSVTNGTRNSYVGLSSTEAGTVMVGKHDTPYKMATASLDPFADTLGDYNGLVGSFMAAGALGEGASTYFDLRPANVLAYVSPNLSGFTFVGAYVFGAATATNMTSSTPTTNPYTSGNAESFAGMYTAGPLYLSAAYEKHNFGAAGTGSLDATSIGILPNTSNSAWKLGASYSIMDFTLAALYEKSSDNFSSTGGNLFGHSTWYLSGKYTMGAFDVSAAYGKANSDNVYTTQSDGATQYTLGGDYNFSKRTSVYALYTHLSNDSGAMYNLADTTAPVTFGAAVGGSTISAFSLGVKHMF